MNHHPCCNHKADNLSQLHCHGLFLMVGQRRTEDLHKDLEPNRLNHSNSFQFLEEAVFSLDPMHNPFVGPSTNQHFRGLIRTTLNYLSQMMTNNMKNKCSINLQTQLCKGIN